MKTLLHLDGYTYVRKWGQDVVLMLETDLTLKRTYFPGKPGCGEVKPQECDFFFRPSYSYLGFPLYSTREQAIQGSFEYLEAASSELDPDFPIYTAHIVLQIAHGIGEWGSISHSNLFLSELYWIEDGWQIRTSFLESCYGKPSLSLCDGFPNLESMIRRKKPGEYQKQFSALISVWLASFEPIEDV